MTYSQFHFQVKHSESLHISDTQASTLFIFFGLASFLGRILSGRLCDVQRIESVRVYQLSDLVTGIAAVILPSCTSYTHLIICISFYGFGEGMFITSGNVVLMSSVNPSKRSSAFGLGAMCWGLTAACGPPLAGTGIVLGLIRTELLFPVLDFTLGISRVCVSFCLKSFSSVFSPLVS